MHHFHYKKNNLHAEEVPLAKIAAEVGTPCYVYSHATLERHFKVFDESLTGLPHLVCFAMKANSNLAILRLMVKLGGGIDIVSGGELFRALTAGADPKKIVFSGVGKSDEEMAYALKTGILQFNVESRAELIRLDEVARRIGKRAPVSIRVNPNIDPKTHPYISTGLKKSKFGVDIREGLPLYQEGKKLRSIELVGVSCHIGSQITQLSPFLEAVDKVTELIKKLRAAGIDVHHLDLGGGLGIPYDQETPPAPARYGAALRKKLLPLKCRVFLEPGRVIVGNAGILLTKVLFQKQQGKKHFVIVDGAMNDLIRPALYGSFHQILPVVKKGTKKQKVDVVGPVCESGDFFAQDRLLPVVDSGALLAVMSAGAYGFVMSSTYNSRPRPAEVMVRGSDYFVIRQREEMKDLLKGEHVPKFLV